MSKPIQEDYVYYEGEKFRVEFYFTQKGNMPAKEYHDLSDQSLQVKLYALVKYMADTGRLFDERKFRLVDPGQKIYEFKPKEDRYFNFFFEGRRIIITNAYRKHGQKVDKRELARAINFKMDYEYRAEGGTYYEAN